MAEKKRVEPHTKQPVKGPPPASAEDCFEPIVCDGELIDESDQFLVFTYLGKLPAAQRKDALEEDSELGRRLRTAWASYIDFKARTAQ